MRLPSLLSEPVCPQDQKSVVGYCSPRPDARSGRPVGWWPAMISMSATVSWPPRSHAVDRGSVS
jgi:hypothetical protein